MIPGVIEGKYSLVRSEGYIALLLLLPFSNTLVVPKEVCI